MSAGEKIEGTPQMTPPGSIRNVPDIILQRATEAPGHIAYSVPSSDGWKPITSAEFVDEVIEVAKGLVAAGVQPGESVAVMSATRYEWTVIDFAVMFAGGVVVPIYETNTVDQAAFVLSDASVVAAFAEGNRHRGLLNDAAEKAGVTLKGLWRFTPSDDLDGLKQAGRTIDDAEIEKRRQIAGPDDVASLVYTSGTVADPRGAMITHGNLAHLTQNIIPLVDELLNEEASTVLLLPLAHILARFIQLALFVSGARTAHVRDASRVSVVLGEINPTVLVVVPRVLRKVLQGVRKAADEKRMGGLFDRAHHVGISYGKFLEARDAGGPTQAPLGLRLQHALYDRLFYARIRHLLGGRLAYMVSGAAPLDPDLSWFFRGVGVSILEGYGLTETTAPLTVNLPHRIATGTVGPPVPGTTIRISEDGEISAKGIGVFAGYHHDQGRDFDADGWFATGDLGEFDVAGRLRITGRAKDIIVTEAGKNIAPQKWEGVVERDPLIGSAVVVGDKRPHATALLFVDPTGLSNWAQAHNKPELASQFDTLPPVPGQRLTDPDLVAAAQALVNEANAGVGNAERIHQFAVVAADISEAAGYTTPTMKLKRGKLVADMGEIVDTLY